VASLVDPPTQSSSTLPRQSIRCRLAFFVPACSPKRRVSFLSAVVRPSPHSFSVHTCFSSEALFTSHLPAIFPLTATTAAVLVVPSLAAPPFWSPPFRSSRAPPPPFTTSPVMQAFYSARHFDLRGQCFFYLPSSPRMTSPARGFFPPSSFLRSVARGPSYFYYHIV